MRTLEPITELPLQLGRRCVATPRERADHNAFAGFEFSHETAGYMPQSPGDPMSLHSRTDRLGDDQTYSGTINTALVTTDMDNDVRLGCPDSPLDGCAEVGGAGHPILRGEQRR